MTSFYRESAASLSVRQLILSGWQQPNDVSSSSLVELNIGTWVYCAQDTENTVSVGLVPNGRRCLSEQLPIMYWKQQSNFLPRLR